MKFKALAVSAAAAFTLAACGQSTPPTPEEAAAARATAEAKAFDVTCRDPSGAVTFEGATRFGLESYKDSHVAVETLDGQKFEQYGGHCIAISRGR